MKAKAPIRAHVKIIQHGYCCIVCWRKCSGKDWLNNRQRKNRFFPCLFCQVFMGHDERSFSCSSHPFGGFLLFFRSSCTARKSLSFVIVVLNRYLSGFWNPVENRCATQVSVSSGAQKSLNGRSSFVNRACLFISLRCFLGLDLRRKTCWFCGFTVELFELNPFCFHT